MDFSFNQGGILSNQVYLIFQAGQDELVPAIHAAEPVNECEKSCADIHMYRVAGTLHNDIGTRAVGQRQFVSFIYKYALLTKKTVEEENR